MRGASRASNVPLENRGARRGRSADSQLVGLDPLDASRRAHAERGAQLRAVTAVARGRVVAPRLAGQGIATTGRADDLPGDEVGAVSHAPVPERARVGVRGVAPGLARRRLVGRRRRAVAAGDETCGRKGSGGAESRWCS